MPLNWNKLMTIHNLKFVDNTRASAYKECPRKYFLRHEKGWRSEGTAAALVFGSAWHEAMDAVWGLISKKHPPERVIKAAMVAFEEKWVEEGMPAWDDMDIDATQQLEPRTPGVAAEMIYNYVHERYRFISEEIELIAIEQPFAVDVGIPGMLYVGRLDKVFRTLSDGKIHVGEHKTTTAYKKDGGFRNDWLDSWSPNSQIDGYLHAAHMLYGDDVKDAWVDGALVHKHVHDKFKFIPVNRQFAMLEEWHNDLRYWINLINMEREAYGRLREGMATENVQPLRFFPTFPKNTNSCNIYNGCSFKDICRYTSNPDTEEPPMGFVHDPWSPFDVLELEKIGLESE